MGYLVRAQVRFLEKKIKTKCNLRLTLLSLVQIITFNSDYKQDIMRRICTILCCLMMAAPLAWAQSGKKQVTMTITRELNGVQSVIDTSFTVNDPSEVEDVLRQMGVEEPGENQTLEKRIVIRDIEEETRTRTVEVISGKPLLGVYLDEGNKGLSITGLTKGGGAEAAGLKKGDVIIRIDGIDTEDMDDIKDSKEGKRPGEDVRVYYLRDGSRSSTVITLGSVQKKANNYNYNYNNNNNHNSNSNHNKEHIKYTTKKTFLGVVPSTVTASQARELDLPEARGVYLSSVVDGHSAQAAGLERGDVIIEMDGTAVYGNKELTRVLQNNDPGATIRVRYVRDGRVRSTDITLGYKEETKSKWVDADQVDKVKITEHRAYMGVYLETDGNNNGVRITRVIKGAAAERAGLSDDDVITSMGGRETPNYNALVKVLRTLDPDQRVTVRIRADGGMRSVNMIMGDKTIEKWEVKEKTRNQAIDVDVIIKEWIRESPEGQAVSRDMNNPSLDMAFFNIYPNPSSGRFNLQFRPEDDGPIRIRIFNPAGRTVYTEQLTDFNGVYDKEIDLTDQAKGFYFLQITQNGDGMAKRLVIQ